MRKLSACMLTVLILLLTLSLSSCESAAVKELSCEQIIKAYEDAGYYVSHGKHNDSEDEHFRCYIKASVSKEPEGDYIYFITCFTEEQAREIAETDKYHIVKWLFAAPMGESRWLKSGTYGKIEYSYYNSELIKPFNALIK